MRAGAHPLAEKLAFFWHGHFATSNTKLKNPELMWSQYRLFREKGAGAFRDLVLAVSRDPAMIRWLDGHANRKGHANENYARELQELFTLGIGNYTEEDIREVGRAFTGWGVRHDAFVYSERFHDDGEKTIHGKSGRFGGEEALDIICALPACSRFIAGKLLRFFSHPDPTTEEVEALAAVFRETDGNVTATLEALFKDDAFLDPTRHRVLVKGPVEVSIGALRAAGVDHVPQWVHGALDRMGQILFRPPSVKGWTSGTGWLSSGAIVERLGLAQRVAALAGDDVPEHIVATALQGRLPAPLAARLEDKTGRVRTTIALGCPEFQLS